MTVVKMKMSVLSNAVGSNTMEVHKNQQKSHRETYSNKQLIVFHSIIQKPDFCSITSYHTDEKLRTYSSEQDR